MSQNENQPDVSVIIATRNSGRTLSNCLDSLSDSIAYFYPNTVEVIFVDYESQDETLNIISGFQPSVLIKAKEPGIAYAHNIGVKAARGKYICFLNSDDQYSENFIRLLYERISENNNQPTVAYCTVIFIDSENRELYRRYPPLYIEWIHRYNSIILHPNAMYPSNLMKIYKFEEHSDRRPSDREQVLKLMRHVHFIRIRNASYRFRIWGSSETVRRAQNEVHIKFNLAYLLQILARTYIHLHEDKIISRSYFKLMGRSHWNRDNK